MTLGFTVGVGVGVDLGFGVGVGIAEIVGLNVMDTRVVLIESGPTPTSLIAATVKKKFRALGLAIRFRVGLEIISTHLLTPAGQEAAVASDAV